MYNKITFGSPIKIDYLIMTSQIPTEKEITSHENKSFLPNWDSMQEMEIFCPYSDNLVSTYIESLTSPVVSWKIYRQFKNERRSELVCEVPRDCLSILDYKLPSNKDICYYVVPQTIEQLGISLESEYVNPNWDGYTLIPLYEIKKNIFVPKNAWIFRINIMSGDIEKNYDKTRHENFTRYPKYSIGERNYETSNLSSFLSQISCDNNTGYDDSLSLLEELEKEIYSGRQCLYKDPKGRMRLVVIESFRYRDEDYIQMPTSVNISWAELGSIDNIQVYSQADGGDAK